MHKRKSCRVSKKVINAYYKNNPFSTNSSAALYSVGVSNSRKIPIWSLYNR